jgi:hypothetical protein
LKARQAWVKKDIPISKITRTKGFRGMAQVRVQVQCPEFTRSTTTYFKINKQINKNK